MDFASQPPYKLMLLISMVNVYIQHYLIKSNKGGMDCSVGSLPWNLIALVMRFLIIQTQYKIIAIFRQDVSSVGAPTKLQCLSAM